ncbi:conjugal transfer protein TraB [Streptomyces sp. S07_1.15]|uniref:conjugal transfer protein TraB n=1 Tax=Streptomyces sp. S07_1.15 TaxID=2873925 RepID=UPI001D152746|nr:conjugal transfer protein TraB [Streptomyces sp. S07_1.15]MCC3654741.1 conjugal transfer protein TraB [Streptomyces sp. S07_1.15]
MGSEIEPYTVHLPDRAEKPSFTRLMGQVATLTASALALKEGLWLLKRRMEHDAADADHLAEQCAAAEVEPKFTGLVHEAGAALRAVAEASGEVAGAADVMEHEARGLGDAHQAEYRGVYEAVNASGVRQAKPGFYRTR